jgi:exopolysaccharide biosynthesis polyprenyl glycosylphosphotransferase
MADLWADVDVDLTLPGQAPVMTPRAPRLRALSGDPTRARHVHIPPSTVLRAGLVLVDGLTLTGVVGVVGTQRGDAAFFAAALLLLAWAPLRICPSVPEELGSLTWRVAAAAAFAGVVTNSGGAMVRTAVVAALCVPAGRLAAYAVLRWSREHDHGLEPTVLVGTGPVARRLATALTDHHQYGLRPVGFVDESPAGSRTDLPVLGDLPDLATAVARAHATRVILAYGGHRDHELAQALRAAGPMRAAVYYVPRFFELGVTNGGRSAEEVWGVPLVRLGQVAARRLGGGAKRALDLGAGLVLLALAAPFLAVIAAAVRITSPGPALFRQERVGKDGRRIDVLKFRTLMLNDDSDTTWSVAGDERCTRIGAFLRRTNLDELPQLINVVRGEMSLVGPRPERPYFVERFAAEIPSYRLRHRVPAGITGLSQVHGLRGDTSIEERVRFDNRYIDAWSLRRDLVILLATVRTFVCRSTR